MGVPGSAHFAGSGKLTMVDATAFGRLRGASPLSSSAEAGGEKVKAHDVDLQGLIESGKGKREKRGKSFPLLVVPSVGRRGHALIQVTTATSLGFDFVANPTTIVLPETTEEEAASSKFSMRAETPSTPALVPSLGAGINDNIDEEEDGEEEDEEEMDDEWEHVSYAGLGLTREEQEEEDDAVVVFGELELEDEVDVEKVPEDLVGGKKLPGAKSVGKGSGKGVSYAAALAKV